MEPPGNKLARMANYMERPGNDVEGAGIDRKGVASDLVGTDLSCVSWSMTSRRTSD
jgi:hypothetical protein